MSADQYWSGDEVISYSMSNSQDSGWIFSSGRAVMYFKEKILTDTFLGTVKNLGAFALDVIQNFKKSEYFSYPRPAETGWYTQAEIADCFRVLPNERFSYGSVYLNSMGDDCNSFLYYSLMHTAGSLFPQISDSPWSGYLVNLIAFLFQIVMLYLIAKKLGLDEKYTFLVTLVYGVSNSCLLLVSNIRPYIAASVFQLWLYYLHLSLFACMDKGEDKRFSKVCRTLVFVYMVGYVAHYTTIVWAGLLGINTVLLYWKKNKLLGRHYIRTYILSGMLAILAGFMIDPISVLGLASKFIKTHTVIQRDMLEGLSSTLIKFVTINQLGLYVIGAFILFCLVLVNAQPDKSDTDKGVLLLGSIILEEGVALLLVTKQFYSSALFPLIYLVLVYLAARAFSLSRKRIPNPVLRSAIAVCLIAAYGAFSFRAALSSIRLEGEEQKVVMGILEDNRTADIVYIRGEGDCYEFVPVLRNYEQTLVITPAKGDYHGLENTERYQAVHQLAVVSTDTLSTDNEILGWMAENGFVSQKTLFEGDMYKAYLVARDAQSSSSVGAA